MNQAFCHNCQIFLETIYDYCWKCSNKIEILNVVKPIISENKTINSSSPAHFPPTSEFVTDNQENQKQYSQTNKANQTRNDWANSARSSHSQQTDFQPGGYRNPNPTNNQYRANADNQNNTIFTESNFSTIVKPAILAVVVFVGLGFLCSYTKTYFAGMPEQQVKEIEEAKFKPGKPQKLWFSSWFRSQPTAEEVFEKFEEVTSSKGKNLLSQTMLIKGNVQFSFPDAELEKTYKELKTGFLTDSFPNVVSNRYKKPNGEIWGFDIEIEVSMKSPNKLLLSMLMTPKDSTTKNVKLYSLSGTNGAEKWVINKAFVNGDRKESESNLKTLPTLFSNDTDSLTMTFVKEEYKKNEFIGVETIADRNHYFIKATKPAGQTDSLYFDVETGLVNKSVGKDGEVYIVNYSDMNGVKLPAKMLVKADKELILMTFSEIKKDIPLDDSIFLKSSYQ